MFLGNQLLKVFFDDALSVRAVLCWTKFGKNLASDFFGPKLKFEKVKKIPSFHMLLVGNVKLTFVHFVCGIVHKIFRQKLLEKPCEN